MRQVNLFYIAVVLIGISLFTLFQPDNHSDLSFYGFAESDETEINYNYSVVVEQILVTPGQAVKAGDTLLHLSRRQSKETLEDQNFRIAELKAEEALWRQKKEHQLAELELAKQSKLSELEAKITQKKKELAFKKSLSADLKSITPNPTSYKPQEEEIEILKAEQLSLQQNYDLQLDGLRKELALGDSPYKEQIKRLAAEQIFDAAQKLQPLVVTAPANGLIGNISCKEEEHIPAYTTLLSFYEPHSGLIKGYVHEDLTMQVQIGDRFKVSSLKDVKITYEGRVIGLGSRIVEIPTRLRKMIDLKTYGREVLVEIPKANRFLQKEKVSLSFISSNKKSD